jgi:prepilin-type N-terminal cleavage/methylation domain-containing protein
MRLAILKRLCSASRFGPLGFTLPEILVSMVLFVIIMGLIIVTHVYGIRMFSLTRPKLSASDDARKTVGRLVDEIRSAHIVRVGRGDGRSFTEITPGLKQFGNALLIHPSTNTNTYIRYYWDRNALAVQRITDSSPRIWTIAKSVSNEWIFAAEDHTGKLLTNNVNNRVIAVRLDFFETVYPKKTVGSGGFYEYYTIQVKATRRKI